MKETNCIKRAHIVIGEGLIDTYHVVAGEKEARVYASRRASKEPGTHWIVFSPVCGFVEPWRSSDD